MAYNPKYYIAIYSDLLELHFLRYILCIHHSRVLVYLYLSGWSFIFTVGGA